MAQALVGPVGSQIANLFVAKKMYEDGEYARMVESMSPRALSNLVAAGRMQQNGVRGIKGDKLINRDLTPGEIINKAIGFNPSVITDSYAANSAIVKQRDKQNMAKSHLVNRYLSALPTERNELFNGPIKDYNATVTPQEAITRMSLLKSERSRKGADKHTVNGLYLSKKNEHLRNIGRFAKDE
jgi:hypothetical protein